MRFLILFLSVSTLLFIVGSGVIVVDMNRGGFSLLKARVLGDLQTQVQKQLVWDIPIEALPGPQSFILAAVDSQGNRVEQEITVQVQQAEVVDETVLRFDPVQVVAAVGGEFAVDILLDTPVESATAVVLEVVFSDQLEFVAADASTSIFDQEVVPVTVVDNTLRTVRLAVGNDYQGEGGQVLRLRWRSIGDGAASVTINGDASQVISQVGPVNILDRVTGMVVATEIEQKQICVQVGLNVRGNDGDRSSVSLVTVVDEATGQQVGEGTVTSEIDGKVYISDQALVGKLHNEAAYTIGVTPEGYLPTLVTGVRNILVDGQCQLMPEAVWGDFDGDGGIDLSDLNRVVNFYQTGEDALLERTFGSSDFGIFELVRFVGSYRQQIRAEEQITSPVPSELIL